MRNNFSLSMMVKSFRPQREIYSDSSFSSSQASKLFLEILYLPQLKSNEIHFSSKDHKQTVCSLLKSPVNLSLYNIFFLTSFITSFFHIEGEYLLLYISQSGRRLIQHILVNICQKKKIGKRKPPYELNHAEVPSKPYLFYSYHLEQLEILYILYI